MRSRSAERSRAEAQGEGGAAPEARRLGLRFATNEAVKGWGQICSSAPSSARAAWDRITSDPRVRDARQHPLKGTLATRMINGEQLEQWQYEVTAGGRIWYCIDDGARTVWMSDASPGHPKATE